MKLEVDNVVCLMGDLSWTTIDFVFMSTSEMSKFYGYIYVNKDDECRNTTIGCPKS